MLEERRCKIDYWREVGSIYISFSDEPEHEAREFEATVIVGVDKNGNLKDIEILFHGKDIDNVARLIGRKMDIVRRSDVIRRVISSLTEYLNKRGIQYSLTIKDNDPSYDCRECTVIYVEIRSEMSYDDILKLWEDSIKYVEETVEDFKRLRDLHIIFEPWQ